MAVVRKLRIKEISAVDQPANKHARVTIMKNAGQPVRYHIPDDALESIAEKLTETFERAGGDASGVIAEITSAWATAYPHKAPADIPDEEEPEPAPATDEDTSTEDDEEDDDMSKNEDDHFELDEQQVISALSKGYQCSTTQAFHALAEAEAEGEDAVQKLLEPVHDQLVEMAVLAEDREARAEMAKRRHEKRDQLRRISRVPAERPMSEQQQESMAKRGEGPNCRALREQLYANPEEFGYSS